MTCALDSLKSSKTEEILPFLELSEESYKLDKKKFSCCQGEGFYLSEKDKISLVNCSLKKRLSKVKSLINCYKSTWEKPIDFPSFSSKDFRAYWNWFILYKHGHVFKGYHLNDDTPGKTWSLALMGVWRLDLDCFVYNLKQHSISHFFSYLSTFDLKERSPIIFLEVEDGLQSLQKREEITYFISWCEKHLSPLWIINSTKKQNKSEPLVSNTMLKKFSRRIDKTKQKHFIQNLEKDSLSKLSTLCITIQSKN